MIDCLLKTASWACCALIVSGCAISNTFVSYNSLAAHYRKALGSGNVEGVLSALEKQRNMADKQLLLAERARIAQVAGDLSQSEEDFAGVIAAQQVEDNKARISLSAALAQTSTTLLNDAVIPYSMPAYERVMVHHYQALNYLFSGDVQSAAVEVRRANFLQKEALQKHQKEVADAYADDAQLQQLDFDRAGSSFSQAVAQVKNSFQNAYSFYLSGLIFEASDSPNDAYIDYKKALEIQANNPFIQADVLRLARQLGFQKEYERFRAQFDIDPPTRKSNTGTLVVFYESEFIPPLQESRIDFPDFSRGGFISIAVPFYSMPWTLPVAQPVTIDGEVADQVALLVDFYPLAAKALEENMPQIALRQFARVIAKRAAYESVERQGGSFAGGALAIFNLITERADVRSWSTLPRSTQLSRMQLEAGTHQLQVGHHGTMPEQAVDIKAGEITLVYITDVGNKIYTKTHTF